MIFDDFMVSGEEEDKSSQIPKTKLPSGPSEEPVVKDERKFAADFWLPADPPEYIYYSELLFGSLFALIFFVVLVYQSSVGAVIMGGLLLSVLVVRELRGYVSRLLFAWRNREHVIDLKIQDNFQTHFLKDHDDVLFIKTRRALIGTALYRYKAVALDPTGSKTRFIRATLQLQVPLFWHHQQARVSQDAVFQGAFDRVRREGRFDNYEPYARQTRLESQGGIWCERIILGSSRTIPAEEDSQTARKLLRELLLSDLLKIRAAMRQTYLHAVLEPLHGIDLMAAYQFTVQLGAPISFFGTGYEDAQQYLELPDILSKSISASFPAEFIVPTRVPHDFVLGKSFETEFQQTEVPIGFVSHELLNGVLVIGGTNESRFLTNTKLVFEATERELNYLIITSNPAWRRILDLLPSACLFRLGEDLIWNPMDPEDCERIEYGQLLAQVFTQLFHLSDHDHQWLASAIFNCLEMDQSTDLATLGHRIEEITGGNRAEFQRALNVVSKFLDNLRLGKICTMLGEANIPLKKLINGINIIEIDLKEQKHLQLLVLCFLAKILAFGRNNFPQKLMILIDDGDVLAPLDPHDAAARGTEPYLLEWVRRFQEDRHLGLHLSIQAVSRFTDIVLANFPHILAHRTSSPNDIRMTSNLLQLLPNEVVLARGTRHDNREAEYLKILPQHRLLIKHPTVNHGFPMELAPLDLSGGQLWDAEAIQRRVQEFFPEWSAPEPENITLLERDFAQDLPIVVDLLSLLINYPEVGAQSLLATLNSNPGTDLDRPQLERLLRRLVEFGYIILTEAGDNPRHWYNIYAVTEKGREVLNNYYEAVLDRRNRQTLDATGVGS